MVRTALFVKLFLLFALSISHKIATGQVSQPKSSVYFDTISAQLRVSEAITLDERRNRSLFFYQFASMASEPSTLSIIGTNYHRYQSTDNLVPKLNFILNTNFRQPIVMGGERYYFNPDSPVFFNVQVIPQFVVRIRNNDSAVGDSSLPVRTPSYMPGLKLLFAPNNFFNRSGSRFMYVGFKAFHYSNGQDQDEYFSNGLVNTTSGNFSEDVAFEYSLNLGFPNQGVKTIQWLWLNDSLKLSGLRKTLISNRLQHSTSIKFSFLHHPVSLTNADFYKYRLYPTTRLEMNFTRVFHSLVQDLQRANENDLFWRPLGDAKLREHFRYSVNLSYAPGKWNQGGAFSQRSIGILELDKRINLEASVFVRIPGTRNVAGFLEAAYYGSDPYNVMFQNTLMMIRFGLAFGYFGSTN